MTVRDLQLSRALWAKKKVRLERSRDLDWRDLVFVVGLVVIVLRVGWERI